MKRLLVLLALVLPPLALLADPPTGVVVAHISYLKKAGQQAMIHDEYAREAIIYYLKQNGIPVEHDTFLPTRTVDFEYFTSAQILNGLTGVLLVNLRDDGTLHVQVERGSPDYTRKFDIPSDGAVLPAIDAGLGPALIDQGLTVSSGLQKISPSTNSSDELTKTEPLDWTWWDRMCDINEHLVLVDNQQATANTYLELAVDCALHACYFCRTDEFNCQKYFGKALLYSEVATTQKAPHADDVAHDVRRLADRFGAGFDSSPDQPVFLPEMAILAEFETINPSTVTTYPPVKNLFDFLVRSESTLTIKGHDEAIRVFGIDASSDQTMPGSLDRGLIWAKPHGDEFDAHDFFGNHPTIPLDDVLRIIDKPGFLPDFVQSVAPVVHDWSQDPTAVLDLLHVKKYRDDLGVTNICGITPLMLALCDRIEELAKKEDAFSKSEGLTLADLDSEMINRNLESVINIDGILTGWGWSQEKAVSYLLDTYGRGRIQSFKTFDGPFEFYPWQILDWKAFVGRLKSDSNVDTPSMGTYLWSKLDPDLQQKIQSGSDIDEEGKAAIIAALNSTLSDPLLYKVEGFQAVLPNGESFGSSTILGNPALASPARLAEFNRWMWDLGFGYLVTGPNYDLPRPTAAQMQIFATFDKASQLYFSGKYESCYQLLQPLIPILEKASTEIEYDPNYRTNSQLELLYQVMCRTGRVEDALKVLTAINNKDFAADAFRYEVLRWRRTDFSGVDASFFNETTNSYKDYQTRAEHAFRIHDYVQMETALTTFQYGDDDQIDCQKTLSSILNGKQNDASTWQTFGNYLTVCLAPDSDSYLQNDLHHWVALLDNEFPSNLEWAKLKQNLRLKDWSSLCEAQELLDGLAPAEDLLKAFNITAKITATYVDEPNLSTDGLFRKAWLRQEQALGRYILAETQNLQHIDDLSTLQPLIAQTVATSLKYARSPGVASSTVPREAWFLLYMIKFGEPSKSVAGFCKKLPPEISIFNTGNKFFPLTVSHPETLAALLQNSLSKKSYDLTDEPTEMDYKIDYDCLFQAAVRAKDSSMAVCLARKIALFDQDFRPMSTLLTNSDAGRTWIDRNAPTKQVEADWTKTLGESHDSSGLPIAITQVPDLVEDEHD